MDFWRQTDIVSQDRLNEHAFTLIGAGGIGSVVGLVLVKMGVQNLTVYDPDTIEKHNLPNQTYRISDLGRPKVAALADICRDFAGVEITPRQEPFPVPSMPEGIVVSGVDSLAARREIWEGAISLNPRIALYIDGRMGAQMGRIYTVGPLDTTYAQSLEGEGVQLPCTARAIAYNTFYLAGLMASQVRKFVEGELPDREIHFDLVSNTIVVPQLT